MKWQCLGIILAMKCCPKLQFDTLRKERQEAQAREQVQAAKQPLSPLDQVTSPSSTEIAL